MLYSSLDTAADALNSVYTQDSNGAELQYFGDEINLASNAAQKTLGTATVSLEQFPTSDTGSASCATDVARQYNWGATRACYDAQVRLSLFAPGATAGTVGRPIGSPVTTTVEVPIDPNVKFTVNVSFDFSSQHLLLPDQIVYAISLPHLASSDTSPLGSLNASLSLEGYDVTAGSDVLPGDIFVEANQIPALEPASAPARATTSSLERSPRSPSCAPAATARTLRVARAFSQAACG